MPQYRTLHIYNKRSEPESLGTYLLEENSRPIPTLDYPNHTITVLAEEWTKALEEAKAYVQYKTLEAARENENRVFTVFELTPVELY